MNWLTSETFAHHRGVFDQHVGAAHMYWSTSGVVYNASIMAEGQKSNLTEGYLSRRLRNMVAQQPIYQNANNGQVLVGCPRVHHTPCTSARGCLFPSYVKAFKIDGSDQ